MRINFSRTGQPSGPLGRILAPIVGVLTLVAALMFSLVFVAVVAVVGLVVWGYFWWKTRALRKHLREAQASASFNASTPADRSDGDVIEGEAVRVVDDQHRISGEPH